MPSGEHLKGRKAPGSGRKPGVQNKITNDVRKAIATIAENKIGEVEGWLTDIAKEDKQKALDLYLRLIEYHIPKLARVEMQAQVTVKTHEELLDELEAIDAPFETERLG
jgi:hypothetical protein